MRITCIAKGGLLVRTQLVVRIVRHQEAKFCLPVSVDADHKVGWGGGPLKAAKWPSASARCKHKTAVSCFAYVSVSGTILLGEPDASNGCVCEKSACGALCGYADGCATGRFRRQAPEWLSGSLSLLVVEVCTHSEVAPRLGPVHTQQILVDDIGRQPWIELHDELTVLHREGIQPVAHVPHGGSSRAID